jgi:hypothetical protein
MHFHPEGSGRQLHRLAEEPQDRVGAAMVAGQRAAAREVPHDPRVEQLTQRVHPALGSTAASSERCRQQAVALPAGGLGRVFGSARPSRVERAYPIRR